MKKISLRLGELCLFIIVVFSLGCESDNAIVDQDAVADKISVGPVSSDFKKAEKKTINISPEELKTAKERITKAISESGTLWTLGKNGILLDVDLTKKIAKVFEYGAYVADIYLSNTKELFVIASDGADSADWQILKKIGDSWFVVATLQLDSRAKSKDDSPEVIGLAEYKQRPFVFARSKLYLHQENGTWRKVKLGSKQGYGLQTPFATTNDGFLYVGLNHGEFGGGLVQIDILYGTSKVIEKKSQGDICSQPLDSKCDPITSVTKDPSNGSAVLVGIGLRHFGEHGRVLKVTKDDVVVIFNKTYKYDQNISALVPKNPCSGQNDSENLSSFETEGVFGMQGDGEEGVWAVTGRAVYKITNGQIETCASLPNKFEKIDGIPVARTIPGIILIGTDINWEKSLSGTTPLIAVER